MEYIEFNGYKEKKDPVNHLVHLYENDDGDLFYVEPGFYDGLLGFKEKRAEDFDRIMATLDAMVRKEHRIIFTADFENPWIEREGFIYREIFDITDPLGIFVEDKSRGSDYGD